MSRLVLLSAVSLIAGCLPTPVPPKITYGNGNRLEQVVTVGELSRVQLGPLIDAAFEVGPPQVVLRADENLLPYTSVRSEGGVLTASASERMEPRPVVVVRMPALARLEASRGCEARGQVGPVDRLELVLSEGATLELAALEVQQLSLEARSGVEVKLTGSAPQARMVLEDGITVDTSSLQAGSLQLTAAGGVGGRVRASQSVSGSVTRNSDLRVVGSPPTREVSVTADSTLVYE